MSDALPPLWQIDGQRIGDFDEELGPYVRQLAWYEFGNDRESFAELMEQTAPKPIARFGRPTAAYARAYTALRFRAGDAEEAERGRAKVPRRP
jgi:hypothetical protein